MHKACVTMHFSVSNAIGNGHFPYPWGRRLREERVRSGGQRIEGWGGVGWVAKRVVEKGSERCFVLTIWLVGAFAVTSYCAIEWPF